MKNYFKSMLIFSLSIGLISCEKEKLITPDVPTEVSSKNLREGILVTMPKTYQLIKHGPVTLSYLDDGRLQKVTYIQGARGGASPSYVLYKYGAHSISSTFYYNNKVAQVMTYLLDANGRCYDSKQVDIIQMGPHFTVEKESGFTYLYNPKGQLTTRTDKKHPTQTTSFVYDSAGELNKITNYNPTATNPGLGLESESTLYYEGQAGDPILADLSPINIEAANLPDPYLMIFGKPGKHLVRMITEKFSLDGQIFSYTLNADGYVTKRDVYNISGAALTETKSYDYLVKELGFDL